MRKICKAVLATGAVLTLCAVMAGCGRVEVELNDYIEPKYDGYNTIGDASCMISYGAIVDDHPEAFGLSGNSSQQERQAVKDDLVGKIGGSLDESSMLTNGDNIEFTWNVNDEALSEKYPVTLIYSDIEYTVSGLEELKDFDPFEYIEVSFSGVAPDGQLLINTDNDIPIKDIYFNAECFYGLSNGDTVTVTADHGYLEDLCLDNGYRLVKSSQEYTVEGLNYYAEELGQIPEELMEAMSKQAEDALIAYYSNQDIVKSIKDTELLGHWLISAKDGFMPDTYNTIYCVYKVTLNISGYKVKNKDKGIINIAQTYYNFVKFNNIKIVADGSGTVDLNDNAITTQTVNTGYYHPDSFMFLVGDSIKAYENLDDMFSKCVAAKIDEYNYESTVK